ncbi:MAG: [protein-PII] uridylyltransferase [Mycobacteriales bacterium]|jgi:[protein-PII] uridylyltransferase
MVATSEIGPPAQTLRAGRSALLGRADLVGGPLRDALTEHYDRWLADRLTVTDGVALIAVGGLGRRETAPWSDLDLVLLHRGGRDVAALADAIWYPIWDAKLSLDHSVRTVAEAVAVARSDLRAALGLLDLRHLAGDPALTGLLRESVLAGWRADAARRLPELREATAARWDSHGELAFLLEPDLKESRGGLRDVHALHALAAAQFVEAPGSVVGAARDVLLDVRGELHRRSGRPLDRLVAQEQAGIGAALGIGDANDLLRAVNDAGRVIAFAADTAWRRVTAELESRKRRRLPGRRPPVVPRRPLADGVVEQDGEVVLARDADPWADPVLVLRAGCAAARARLPLAPHALDRLATESAPLPTPWPASARDTFVDLLGAGRAAVPVLEALDRAGLLVRLLPEWEPVRSLPQRNPVHRFTVDRHLIEAAANAAELTRTVSRPDLLLIGALFHDIGKGLPGDHTDAGVRVVRALGPRLGLSYGDAATLVALVQYHLLLPDTATRRDLDDPVTIRSVMDAVAGSRDLLDLLHALSIADGLATGPAAWSDWKAGLVGQLVDRTASVLSGSPLPIQPALTADQRALADAGTVAVRVDGEAVVVAAPDEPGLLSRTAGVLALHQLDVRSATIATVRDAGSTADPLAGAMAVNVFQVTPRFGRGPDPALLRADVVRVLSGHLPVTERLAAKEQAYAPAGGSAAVGSPPPWVLWFDDAATDATVLELRAADAVGLLHRVTGALEQCGLDVRTARVSTLGGAAVDAFYVVGPDGSPVTDAALRQKVEAAVLAAV